MLISRNASIVLAITAVAIGTYIFYANFMEREVEPDYRYIKYVTMDDGTQVENRILQRGDTLVIKSAFVGSINSYVEAAQLLKANNHRLEVAGGCLQNCIYLVDVARRLNVPVCAKRIASFTYQRPSRVNIALENEYLLDSTLEWINLNTNTVDYQPITAMVEDLPGNFKLCS